MFTTTLSSPTSMDLYMPKDSVGKGNINNVKEYGALTLLLDKNNMIYYYEGQLKEDTSNFIVSDFSNIHQVIVNKKKKVMAAHVHDDECKKIQEKARIGDPKNGIKPDPNWQDACKAKDLVVVIKPDDGVTYQSTINILDEMAINDVKRYAMVDLFPIEREIIKKLNSVAKR